MRIAVATAIALAVWLGHAEAEAQRLVAGFGGGFGGQVEPTAQGLSGYGEGFVGLSVANAHRVTFAARVGRFGAGRSEGVFLLQWQPDLWGLDVDSLRSLGLALDFGVGPRISLESGALSGIAEVGIFVRVFGISLGIVPGMVWDPAVARVGGYLDFRVLWDLVEHFSCAGSCLDIEPIL